MKSRSLTVAGWALSGCCLLVSCDGQIRNLGDEPDGSGGDRADATASGGSSAQSTTTPQTQGPGGSTGTTSSGVGGATTTAPPPDAELASMTCDELSALYDVTAVQASSCVAGANYTQCVGLRLVGLVCACPTVIHYPQVEALNLLTAIEAAWVAAQCGWPNAKCSTCASVAISSAWGGCNPTTGRCEYHSS